MTRETCQYCLRPRPTAEDFKTCAEGEGEHLCWEQEFGRCYEINLNLKEAAPAMAALLASMVAVIDFQLPPPSGWNLAEWRAQAKALLARARGEVGR